MPGPRLALLGDIHGNLPALDAVLAAVREAGITRAAVTGDLAARGSEPEACVARVRGPGGPASGGTPTGRPRSTRSCRPAARAWLRALPRTVVVRLGGARVLVCHSPADGLRGAEAAQADCVVTGHTHRPRISRTASRLEVDPGSVGEGVPGERRPSWAWLEAGPDGIEAHPERVPAPLARVRIPGGRRAPRAAAGR